MVKKIMHQAYRTSSWRERALAAVAITFLGTTSYFVAREVFVDRREPVKFVAGSALNSPLKQGTRLEARIWRSKTRLCPLVAQPYASRLSQTGEFILKPRVKKGGPVNTEYIDLTYDTTRLPPGDFLLMNRLFYICEDKIYNYDQPPVPFKVVP